MNWRSGIGVSRGIHGQAIVLAHTLVPPTNLSALTAYGRGLTQHEMAEFMIGLGAQEALVLDGGPSAAFRLENRIISGGLRKMPLCIVVEKLSKEPNDLGRVP